MIEMYKGMVNSPVAELTEAISESATIIKVNNINAFPDAPNLATIGTEEDAETIMYAAKTDEALSGCQRGVQGVAKAWQTGDKIARNFTQKDHADLIDNVKEIKQKVDEAFQFASNGKQVLSTAVTGKGVQASAEDTFPTLAEKIGQIKKSTGNATSSDVLAGKKFSNENDTDIVGTMVNRGATIITPSTSNKYIASGYHNGSGYVVGDSDLVASNIVQGKNIFGVSGQALQYQQNEKTAIANALTSKGVPTSTTASWGQIEQNIRGIKSGLENPQIIQIKIKYDSDYGTPLGNSIYKFNINGIYNYYDYDLKNKLNLKKGSIIFCNAYNNDYNSGDGVGFLLDECDGLFPIINRDFATYFFDPYDYSAEYYNATGSVILLRKYNISFFIVLKDNPKLVVRGYSYNGTASGLSFWIRVILA